LLGQTILENLKSFGDYFDAETQDEAVVQLVKLDTHFLVERSGNKSIPIWVLSTEVIADLKNELKVVRCLQPELQQLFFIGRGLVDDRAFGEEGLTDGCAIQLIMKEAPNTVVARVMSD